MEYQSNLDNLVGKVENRPIKNYFKEETTAPKVPEQKSYDASSADALGSYGAANVAMQQKQKQQEEIKTQLKDAGLKDETALNMVADARNKKFNDHEVETIKDLIDTCRNVEYSIDDDRIAEFIRAAGEECTFGRKIDIANKIIRRFNGLGIGSLTTAIKEMEGNSIALLASKGEYAEYGKLGLPQDLVIDGLHYVKPGESIIDWQIPQN